MIELNNKYLNYEYLNEQYILNKKSIGIISNETKIAQMTIYDAMLKFNIPIRKSKKFQIPRDILYIEYIENRKTIKEISDIFGSSTGTIQVLLKKYKIEARIGQNTHKVAVLSEDVLKKLYVDDDLKIREIANKLNISERYVSDQLKKFNISRKRAEKISKKIDLVGKKFGKLTVISLNNNDNFDGYVWNCKCVCGNETKTSAYNLLNASRPTRSCGCSRALNLDFGIIHPYQWNGIVRKASNRGIILSISKKYVEALFLLQNKCCALSGVELCFNRSKERNKTTASLDRIDSKQGYIEGNVQWIHKILNIAKHTTPNKEFINWCKLVAEFNK